MESVAITSDHWPVATTDDPYGLAQRIKQQHSLTFKAVGEALGIGSPQTVTRAIRTDKPSVNREKIIAYLDELDRRKSEEQVADVAQLPGVGAGREDLDKLMEGKTLSGLRIEYGRSGKTRLMSVFIHDPNLTPEERAEEERLWRRNHGQ